MSKSKRKRTSAAVKRPEKGRTAWWLGSLVALILIGSAIWYFHARSSALAIPEISTTGLETNAATMIEGLVQEVRAHPKSAAAWGKLGGTLKSFDYRQAALRCLLRAQHLDPADARWPYLQVSLLESDLPETAIQQAQHAVELCGNDPARPRLELARLLLEQGRREEAQRHYEALLSHDPGLGPAQLGLAQIAQASGNLDQALNYALTCTTNPYTAKAAWSLVSSLQWRRGDTNSALIASRKSATASPDVTYPDPFDAEFRLKRNDARGLSDQAQEYLLSGRAKEAAPVIERLVAEHPQFAESWLLLGRLFYLKRDLPPAVEALQHHLQLDSNSVNGFFQLGMCQLAQQQYAQAIASFDKAINLKPNFGAAHFNIAFALAKSGRKEEAIPHFQESIRHNPEHIDSYILLADLFLQLGNSKEAVHWANLAASMNPSDPRVRPLQEKILHGKESR